jgi:hypothetical protein
LYCILFYLFFSLFSVPSCFCRFSLLHSCALVGDNVQLQYDNGEDLVLTWSRPFVKGEERQVAISYEIVRPVSGFFFHDDDHCITDHETERWVGLSFLFDILYFYFIHTLFIQIQQYR